MAHSSSANHESDAMNVSTEWEKSRSFLKKHVPYIPSKLRNVDEVIVVGGFSKSLMVHFTPELHK